MIQLNKCIRSLCLCVCVRERERNLSESNSDLTSANTKPGTGNHGTLGSHVHSKAQKVGGGKILMPAPANKGNERFA